MRDKVYLLALASAAMAASPIASVLGESVVSYAWTGRAADNSISLPDNWASGAMPDMTGYCTATFTAADSTGFHRQSTAMWPSPACGSTPGTASLFRRTNSATCFPSVLAASPPQIRRMAPRELAFHRQRRGLHPCRG